MKDDISYKSSKSISFERIDETSYKTEPFVNGARIVGTIVHSNRNTYNLDYNFSMNSLFSSSYWKSTTNIETPAFESHWIHDTNSDIYTFKIGATSIYFPLTIDSISYEKKR